MPLSYMCADGRSQQSDLHARCKWTDQPMPTVSGFIIATFLHQPPSSQANSDDLAGQLSKIQHPPDRLQKHTRPRMNKTLVAAVFAALIAVTAAAPELHAPSSSQGKRQLLQWSWNRNVNLASNTARASIATSDAINRAVDNGASLRATRGASIVGSNMAWAAAQGNQDVFDTVQRFYDGRKLKMMAEAQQA